MDIRTLPRILEYPQGKSYSTPSSRPLVRPFAHGIRAKIREKSFPKSPSFYYLSAPRDCSRVRRRVRGFSAVSVRAGITRSNASCKAWEIRQSLASGRVLLLVSKISRPPCRVSIFQLLTKRCNAFIAVSVIYNAIISSSFIIYSTYEILRVT